ncbi:MAG TPA: HPF/RaiA family ribosome-associated protein [Candidatus Saccharibacteria bacterium]|nr:HPF/RaiA family ribosome-associated protein [Candidatus Saccharibacteria bacterium]
MTDYQFTAKGIDDHTKLRRYADKKIATLLRRLPRGARESAKLAVVFTQSSDKKQKSCRITVQLPHQTLVADETTIHLYAALDIASAEIKRQMGEYKTMHSQQGVRHRVARMWRRQST